MSSIRSLMLRSVGVRDLLKVSDRDIAAALGKFADQGLRDGVMSYDAALQQAMAKDLLHEGMASTGDGGKMPAFNSAAWNRLWDAINHKLNESGAQNLDSAISEWDKSYSYGKDGANPR